MPKYRFDVDIDYDLQDVGCCVCPYSRRYEPDESECILNETVTYGLVKWAEEALLKQCPLEKVETPRESFERKAAEFQNNRLSMTESERDAQYKEILELIADMREKYPNLSEELCDDYE